MAGLRGGGSAGMDDLFSQFFSSSSFGFEFDLGGGASRRRTKGQDSIISYDVTLEDLYNGKAVKMNMEKDVVCGICKGYVV